MNFRGIVKDFAVALAVVLLLAFIIKLMLLVVLEVLLCLPTVLVEIIILIAVPCVASAGVRWLTRFNTIGRK